MEHSGSARTASGAGLVKAAWAVDSKNRFYRDIFSGNEAKASFAGAFIHEPQLIMLDEPLNGLDAAAARLVKTMLLDYVQQGNSVILTTHVLDVAERMAQQIGILNRGRLIAAGTLDELRARSGEAGGTLESVFLELIDQSDRDADESDRT